MANTARDKMRKPFDLSGKIAVVTGAGRGIGASIAECLAAQGAKVLVANRTLAYAQDVAAAIEAAGGQAEACEHDGATRAGNEALVIHALERFGGLDILVHNAASIRRSRIEDIDEATLDDTLDVSLKSCFWLARAALAPMRERGGGRFLVTSSVTGPRVVLPELSHYAAAKAGVNGFIRAAALEFAPYGITVNGVEPGFIAAPARGRDGTDDFSRRVKPFIPAGEIGRPEDIAYAMLYLASNEAAYVTGQTIVVDGGAVLPESPAFMTAITA